MKNYTLRMRIKNTDRGNQIKTIQYSRDDYQDIQMFIRDFEIAEHITILYKHIRDNVLQEKLKRARAKVTNEN